MAYGKRKISVGLKLAAFVFFVTALCPTTPVIAAEAFDEANLQKNLVLVGETSTIKDLYLNFERFNKACARGEKTKSQLFGSLLEAVLPVDLLGGCDYQGSIKLFGLCGEDGERKYVYFLPIEGREAFFKTAEKKYTVVNHPDGSVELRKRLPERGGQNLGLFGENKDQCFFLRFKDRVAVLSEDAALSKDAVHWKKTDEIVANALTPGRDTFLRRGQIQLCLRPKQLVRYLGNYIPKVRAETNALEKELLQGSGLARLVSWILDGYHNALTDAEDIKCRLQFGRFGLSADVFTLPRPGSDLAKMRDAMTVGGRPLAKSNLGLIPSRAFLAGSFYSKDENTQRMLRLVSRFLKVSSPRGSELPVENFHQLLEPVLGKGESDFTFALLNSSAAREFELQLIMVFNSETPDAVVAAFEEYSKKAGCAPFLQGGKGVSFYRNSVKHGAVNIHEIVEKDFDAFKLKGDQRELIQAIYGIGKPPTYYLACVGGKVILLTGSNGLDMMREMIDAVRSGKAEKSLVGSVRFESAMEQVPVKSDALIYFGAVGLLRTLAEFGREIAGENLGREIPVLAPTLSGMGISIRPDKTGYIRVKVFLPSKQCGEILRVLNAAGSFTKWKGKKGGLK